MARRSSSSSKSDEHWPASPFQTVTKLNLVYHHIGHLIGCVRKLQNRMVFLLYIENNIAFTTATNHTQLSATIAAGSEDERWIFFLNCYRNECSTNHSWEFHLVIFKIGIKIWTKVQNIVFVNRLNIFFPVCCGSESLPHINDSIFDRFCQLWWSRRSYK